MIGVLLHLGACALDELFENFEEFRADLGWAVTFAASAARMGLAARLDPEAARAVGEVARLRVERDAARAQREEWKQNAVNAAQRDLGHLIERDDLRRLVLDAVNTRERLEASDAAAEETGGIKRLDLLVQAMETWNALVEAARSWSGVPPRACADCKRLRAERDLARLEHAAAVEVCEELRGLLETALHDHAVALRVLESLLPKVEVTP